MVNLQCNCRSGGVTKTLLHDVTCSRCICDDDRRKYNLHVQRADTTFEHVLSPDNLQPAHPRIAFGSAAEP